MTVGAFQHYRIGAADRIEIVAGRHAPFRPAGFDPAAAIDGLAGGGAIHAGFDDGNQFSDGGGSFQIEGQFAHADAEQVGVRVGEAGIKRRALEVDDDRIIARASGDEVR